MPLCLWTVVSPACVVIFDIKASASWAALLVREGAVCLPVPTASNHRNWLFLRDPEAFAQIETLHL